jgi:hypothetical protein
VQKSPYLDNEFLEVAKPKQDSNYFPVWPVAKFRSFLF